MPAVNHNATLEPQHKAIALTLLIALGVSLRLLAGFLAPNDFTVWPDAQNYVSIARNLATDLRYANSWPPPLPDGRPRYTTVDMGDIGPTSFREPLYPMLLAVQFKTLGDAPRTTFAVQAILQSLSIPLCFGITAMLFSPRSALFAALMESLNPYHIYYTQIVATESISSVVLLSIVFLTLRVLKSLTSGQPIRPSQLVALALAFSAAILTHAVLVSSVVVSLIFIWYASYRRRSAFWRSMKEVGFVVVLTSVVVSPWFIRNYLLWDQPIYSTAGGQSLIFGFNERAHGGFDDGVFSRLRLSLSATGFNELERDRIYRQEALKWIRSHPWRSLYLSIKKQVLFWSPVPAYVTGYQKLAGGLWGFTLLGLTVIGLVRARGESFSQKYVISVIVLYPLIYSIAIALTRYRLPLEGVLAVFAGFGVESLLIPLQARVSKQRSTVADPSVPAPGR
jgi:hypothetical protein